MSTVPARVMSTYADAESTVYVAGWPFYVPRLTAPPAVAPKSPAAVPLTAAAVRRRHERRETSDVGGVGP